MAALKAETRSELGTRKARALRGQGMIPGVVYGHGKGNVAVSLNRHDIDLAVNHGQRLLELDLGGEQENVLVKDVQWDTFGQVILHVDLTRVDLHERVKVTVPIVLRGTPAGMADGGVLQQTASEVEIECMVQSIPEEIRAIINDLQVGDSLRMSDLSLPEGATLVGDSEARVCTVEVLAEEEEAPAAEEAAQPEVIGEKKEEADGTQAAAE